MLWRQAHQEAMVAAAGAHVDGELDTFSRIDVFRAIHAGPIGRLQFTRHRASASPGLECAANANRDQGHT